MKSQKARIVFIGVSWPYASGNIHLGHIMGQYTVCDVFARYHRLKGNRVLMVSGSDCHGAPIIFQAEEQGITPEQLIQISHNQIKDSYKKLGYLYENFTNTHTENHQIVVQNIFNALFELGYLFKKETKQYFDPQVKRFLPDRYVKGTCPKCATTNARGDECPECGEFLSPEDLINPFSTLSDTVPILKETEHFYMDLQKTEAQLLEFLKNKDYWRDWVREYSIGFIKDGLKPRAVTRDFKFGVKVPFKGWENKVIYVWIEAVVGYLSAAIEWAQIQTEKGNLLSNSVWEEFWKNDNCKHYYFIAGGNAPFHTIIWPAELIAYNEKYKTKELFNKYLLPGESLQKPLNLPFDVPANKILLYKGRKMSKGDHSNIPLEELLKMFSPDLIRYFSIKLAPENHDRDFIWKDFIDLNNNELVANIGNFVNRTISFTNSKFEGKIPSGNLEKSVITAINVAFSNTANYLEKTEFVKAIEELLTLGHFANKYFNDKKPWETINADKNLTCNTLYNSIQIVEAFRILLKPFLPFTSIKIQSLLNINEDYDPNMELEQNGFVTKEIDLWEFIEIKSGHNIGKTEVLFEKLEYSKDLEARDSFDPNQSKTVTIKSINFKIDSKVAKLFPVITKCFSDLKVRKIDNKIKLWIEETEKEIKKKYSISSLTQENFIKAYHELDSAFGVKDKLTPAQVLIEYTLTKGNLPKINNVVDIYNAISAKYGISIGVHDIAKLDGQPKLEKLSKDIEYMTIGGKLKDKALKDEYAYTDDQGILCRLEIKQCERTKVTEKTKDIFVIMQGNSVLNMSILEKAMEELGKILDSIDK